MRLYLDTEFNGLGGELISMAIVAEDGREWYQVRAIKGHHIPWVEENVVPHLGQAAIEDWEFCQSLAVFLASFRGCEFIADWPADFEHLAHLMTLLGAEDGFKIPIECTMRLIKGSLDIKPEIPHNALSDARALRDWHQKTLAPKIFGNPDAVWNSTGEAF